MRNLTLCCVVVAGCGEEPLLSGQNEPVRIREGVFHEGELPVDDDAETPLVTNVGGISSIVTAGQASREFNGLASTDGYAVAVSLPGVSAGYWVVPLGAPDVTQANQLAFRATADFGPDVPFGLQTLTFVAIGSEENPGPRYDTIVCVLPAAANNNLAACDPATMPQSVVLSLTWDTNVDLDLVVVAPNGKVVSAKHPSTALLEEGAVSIPSEVLNDPTTGQVTRDSNGNCHIDGIRRESLVFSGAPPAGNYKVYVGLNRACGQSYVNFKAELLRRVDAEDGTFPVERSPVGAGELLAIQADGGATLGTYLTTLTLP